MRSKFFAKYDLTDHKSFPRDIKALVQMPRKVVSSLPEWTLKAFEAPTQAETDNVYTEAAAALQQPRSALDHVLDVLQFLLREFAPKGEAAADEPSDLAADLVELFDVPQDACDTLTALLTELKTTAQREVHVTLLKRAHLSAGLPVLNAVSSKVDLRAVFSEEYKYDQDVSKFAPELIGTVPIGILELSIHGGEADKVLLQVSKRTLRVLRDHLAALQKQIEIVEQQTQTLKD